MSVGFYVTYVLINNQVESIAPCWEDVVLQRSGTVLCVDDMAWLQDTNVSLITHPSGKMLRTILLILLYRKTIVTT